jgi:two-component system CheB/CheR fusion protein
MPEGTADAGFAIVGIGASAGGLDALTRLIKTLPAQPGLALVIIQHLDPHHESQLTKILGTQGALRVVDAVDGMKIHPNSAYVIQPGTNVALTDGSLRVTPRVDDRRPHYPVDHFLRSLAAVDGPRAIGVILSGTGSDGTLGLCEIKAAGGVTFAQDDESAQHSGMPQSAVASGAVDLILPPEEIARRLVDLPAHPYLRETADASGATELPGERAKEFQRVIMALRNSSGVDFSQYRDTTIKRRTARRMLLRGFTSAAQYAKFLEKDPGEAEALYRDVLINVTSFFRDPEMFDELKTHVFPELAKNKPASQAFRFWVAGCSTGQEAYSLAIALLEFLEEAKIKRDIQIFATDLGDPAALERARAGVYPEGIESEVSPERLRRFFVKDERTYRIQKSVRDLCVFARQNITVDPPFSRVDLVTCRNVLIYMSTPLQQRLLPMFHFAINQKGFLVLGGAETIGPYADLFELTSRTSKIYRRKDSTHRPQLAFMSDQWMAGPPARHAGADSGHTRPDFQREADRVMLGLYAPASALVNAAFEVQQFRGRTAPFLETPAGQPTTNILRMARGGVAVELRSALNEAKTANARVTREHLRLAGPAGDIEFTLHVVPVVASHGADDAQFLVVFETDDFLAAAPSAAAELAVPEGDAAWLRQELASSKQYVQSVLDAQEASNQELRAAHEEVLSSNEELQSTNEELETTKEELQSANEELTTVNEQFQRRNHELDALADDLSNFIASADVPLLTIGRDLAIRRSTPAAQRAFNVLPTDVGRSIEHIKFALDVPDIALLVEQVIETMQPVDRELQDREGRWWVLRVRPYLTADRRIDGATLVAFDIDSVKRNRELSESRDLAHAIVQTAREPLVVLDAECRVELANESFYKVFGQVPDDVEGRPIWDTCQGVWADPELRRTMTEASQGRRTIVNFEAQRVVPAKGLRTLVLNGRTIAPDSSAARMLLSVDDVTDARQAERLRIDTETLRLLDRRKDEFLGILAHELRNPLAPMKFALDAMRRPDQTPAQAVHTREALERQMNHMIRIVDDLLDVSRITQGKVELRRELLELTEIVRAAVELSRPAIEAVRHSLTVSLPDEPLTVDGDAVRLTQVLVNLLNNAVKFTPPAGHIWVIGETVSTGGGPADRVRLRVRDTGIGIAPEARERVFDIFMQGDRSLERTRGGLGVGLTLVRNLIALHGGTVEARSEGEGHGAEFVVTLPLAVPVEAAAARPPAAAPRPSRRLRILVADDNQDGREMLKYLLEHEGHEVEIAADGPEAVEAAARFDPEVAILDIGMPGLSGYDVASRLRSRPAGHRPLLLALSGLGQAEDKARSAEAGFEHHFTKPVDLLALLGIIAEKVK